MQRLELSNNTKCLVSFIVFIITACNALILFLAIIFDKEISLELYAELKCNLQERCDI